MKLHPFTSIGNDLFANIGDCDCALFPDDPALAGLKQPMKMTGYNDDYFFMDVNAEPRVAKCSKCGVEYWFQWRRHGVLAVRVETP